ncbi:MAG: lysoplasmalogenase [Rhodobacteraceae bacterium]|nr:lysoplasmalogenase [Paracoccaceae bacterium]
MQLAMVLIAAAAGLALIYEFRWAAATATGWPRSATKTASVALLALAAWVAGAPGLIVAGLALGAAGDFALTRPGTPAFLAGMGAFAAGHLAYAAAFAAPALLVLAGFSAGQPWVPNAPDLAAFAVLVVLLGSTEFWLAPQTGALAAPVRGYVAVIGLMAAAALVPAGPGAALLRIGAALFVASDVMLALERFVVRAPGPRRLLARALWPAYWAGQALILLGSLGGALTGAI